MTKKILTILATFSLSAGLLLSASPRGVEAGTGTVPRLRGKHAPSSVTRPAPHPADAPALSSYTFTLLNYPGELATAAIGINKGATTNKVGIVGAYGTEIQNGFLARVSGTKTVSETYQAINVPHATQSWVNGINDLGQMVGPYEDSSDLWHSYEISGGKFTELNVSFAGASGTFAESINDSGEIVGIYTAADGNQYGFTLIGGTYTSLNYPDAADTETNDLNSNGDIVGDYADTAGVIHGFLLSGGAYTSIDFPGGTDTQATGINDSGDIVGVYCPASAPPVCPDGFEGAQGFLLSGGTFTTIAIPNEFYTVATDINNNGVVVGYYQDAAGVVEGFMATP